MNNFKTLEKTKKNKQKNILKIIISIEKISFPIGKLHFSIEIVFFLYENCVFLKLFYCFLNYSL